MADVSPEVRSRIMAAIRGTNTQPEVALRKCLWAMGVRGYRLHARGIPGRPDLYFPALQVAVFVDGCFWHGCPDHYRRPRQNVEFWRAKYLRNRRRDRKVNRLLESEGYTVLRFWEHDLTASLERVARQVRRTVTQRRRRLGR